MEKQFSILFMLLVFPWFYLCADETLPPDIKQYFEEYRAAKSYATATTGKKSDINVRKYYHGMVTLVGNERDKNVYVISNDYTIESLEIRLQEKLEFVDPVIEDVYDLRVIEYRVGVLKDGKIQYYSTPEPHTYFCDISRTEKGLRVLCENTFIHYLILESDVPLLLKRVAGEQ
jgi:hypothetical protein